MANACPRRMGFSDGKEGVCSRAWEEAVELFAMWIVDLLAQPPDFHRPGDFDSDQRLPSRS